MKNTIESTGREGGRPAEAFSRLSPSILDREDRERVGRQIVAVLEDYAGASRLAGFRALDVGCSSGIITAFLGRAVKEIVGVDVDVDAVRMASAAAPPNVSFEVMSGARLDFESASFDLVICNQMYYWLEDPSVLAAEIHRVLKPGGICFFAAVNRYKLWEAQYRLPLLSMLPKWLADRYVRITGRASEFGCHYRSFWGLHRLWRQFVVHTYTAAVLKDPARFKFAKLERFAGVTRMVPDACWPAIEPFSPNFVWVLEKPAR